MRTFIFLIRNTYLKERKDVNDKYRNAVKVVLMWLDSTEDKYEHLPDIARSLNELKNQLEQMKVIIIVCDNIAPNTFLIRSL